MTVFYHLLLLLVAIQRVLTLDTSSMITTLSEKTSGPSVTSLRICVHIQCHTCLLCACLPRVMECISVSDVLKCPLETARQMTLIAHGESTHTVPTIAHTLLHMTHLFAHGESTPTIAHDTLIAHGESTHTVPTIALIAHDTLIAHGESTPTIAHDTYCTW